jgi:hypothetical protein
VARDFLGGSASLHSRINDARPEGFGEDEAIADLEIFLSKNLIGMDKTGHGQAIFQFTVFDTVAAHKHDVGLPYLVQPALNDPAQDGDVQFLEREGDQVHGCLGCAAHGVDIAQGVGSGNLPERVGIVHDGRKKIHGLNESQIVVYPVNAGVIGALQPHQDVLIGWEFEPAQSPVQVSRTQFGCSPGPLDHLGQTPSFLIVHHRTSCR